MIAAKLARCVLTAVFAAVLLPMATAQTVTIAVDRGNGAEYQVGDSITITYAVSVDAAVEVFDISPAGMGSLIDRRQARANQEYALTGVIEPPLGVAVFEVKATTIAGQALTASAFIRIVAGEEPWAWLASADVSQARLVSRRLYYEARDSQVIYSIHAAPQGGLVTHEGRRGVYGEGFFEDGTEVLYLAPGAPPVQLVRGAQGVFVSPHAPSSVFVIGSPANRDSIDELDLVTGSMRSIADINLGRHTIYRAHAVHLRDDIVFLGLYGFPPYYETRILWLQTSSFTREPGVANAYTTGVKPLTMTWWPDRTHLLICNNDSCGTMDPWAAQYSAPDADDSRVRGLRAVALAGSPQGGVHLVDDGGRLWVARLDANQWSNITGGLASASLWVHESHYGPVAGVAWDLKREVIYWVDGSRIFEGVISAPSSQSR